MLGVAELQFTASGPSQKSWGKRGWSVQPTQCLPEKGVLCSEMVALGIGSKETQRKTRHFEASPNHPLRARKSNLPM